MFQQLLMTAILLLIAHYLTTSVHAMQATTLATQARERITPQVPTASMSLTASEPTIIPVLSSVSLSSLITIAPISRNPLELRQKCFNDQGFSVNCATWTGYYYTWGGSGHPYAGGPGDGGSGSTSNSGTSTASKASREHALLVTTLIISVILVGVLTL